MSEVYYMQCGHSTVATLESEGIPICTSCLCMEVVEKPDVLGREAHCSLCGHVTKSSWVQDNPFFRYCADMLYDLYYCGCEGWD